MSFYDIRNEKHFISSVQRMLRDINYLNFDDGGVGVTGIYDATTRDYVRSFQRDMDIEPTGSVDLETWEVLQSVHRSTLDDFDSPRAVKLFYPHSPVNFHPNDQNDILFVIQYMLRETGYFLGSETETMLTGIYDTNTQNAVAEFKRRNLLESDDILDTRTINKLFDEYESLNSSYQ